MESANEGARGVVFAAIAISLVFALVALVRQVEAVPGVADPIVGEVRLVAIDVDSTGNPSPGIPALLGPLDSCRVVSVGQTLTIDVIIDEIDPAYRLYGQETNFTYNGSMLSATAYQIPVGTLDFTVPNEFNLPSNSGAFSSAWVNLGVGYDPGEHVAARLTIEVTAAGTSPIQITSSIVVNYGGFVSPHNTAGAVLTTDPLGCNDGDADGVVNALDNCPIANPDQLDTDGDGEGDACDSDDDGDSVTDGADNCPMDSNSGQENDVHPGTLVGDACEDPDADGVVDSDDICPNDADPGQEETDGDTLGDACDVCPDDPWPSNGGCPFPPSIGGTTTLIVSRDEGADASSLWRIAGLAVAVVLTGAVGVRRLRR